jgi:hypothetical protein
MKRRSGLTERAEPARSRVAGNRRITGFLTVRLTGLMRPLTSRIRALSLTAAIAGACALLFAGLSSAAPSSHHLPLPSKDPFYRYNHPLAHIAPGTVLRKRTVTIDENGNTTPITATQILYRTSGEAGQPTITVTTVIQPKAPVGSTKIVSYQTAYDALGSQCDPSYTLRGGNKSGGSTAEDEEQLILGYVAEGYTVLVPDYEGVRRWRARSRATARSTASARPSTCSISRKPRRR